MLRPLPGPHGSEESILALEPPDLRREGLDYVFHWAAPRITVTIRDVASGRDGPRAEIVVSDPTGHIHTGLLNLLSTSGKATFIKALKERDPEFPWQELVEQFTVLCVHALREGDPLTLLEPQRRDGGRQYVVRPLVPVGMPTLLFGDGAAGKSLLALAICRAAALGETLADMPAGRFSACYLDWEWDVDEHAQRLYELGSDCTLFYLECRTPLVSQVRALGRKLDREGVDFLVLDSLGLACGGDPSDPEVVLNFFGALRSLGRTALIVHHVPKEKKEPYGSVYVRNSVRSAWFMVRSQTGLDGQFLAALRHRKTNFGQYEKDIGLRFSFNEGTIAVERTDAKSIPEIAEGSPVRMRIYDYLDGIREAHVTESQTAEEIALALEVPLTQVRARLTGMKNAGTVL